MPTDSTSTDRSIRQPKVEPRVVFCQDGARLHYALPLALKRAGMLEAVHTDWYRDGSLRSRIAMAMVRLVSADNARRLRQRYCRELDGTPVHCLPLTGPLFIMAFRNRWGVWRGVSRFAWTAVLRHGPLGRPPVRGSVYFSFSHSLPLWVAQKLKNHGCTVLADQPIATDSEAFRQQQLSLQRWPDWAPLQDAISCLKVGDEQVRQLNPMVSHWTCASDYVRQSLEDEGVQRHKISVLPYPVDARSIPMVDRGGRRGHINVGFVGQVGLRKGAPWFLEVAKRLAGKNVHFVMVGPISLSESARRQLGTGVDLVGPVVRSEVIDWLGKFDIFLFPSTCEGSAGAVMEAMATGLPIVTTANSGTIVREGVDGFIRPYDRPDELAECVDRLIGDETLRLRTGRNARNRVEANDIDAYSLRIAALINQLVNGAEETAGISA